MKKYRKITMLLTALLFVLFGMLYLKQVSDGRGEQPVLEGPQKQTQKFSWTIGASEPDSGEESGSGEKERPPETGGTDAPEGTTIPEGEGTSNDGSSASEEETLPDREPPPETGVPTDSADDRININTAGVGELVTLPMIGEKRAEAIIRYRSENGPFQHPEEITAVSGIGKGIYKRIKDRIRV